MVAVPGLVLFLSLVIPRDAFFSEADGHPQILFFSVFPPCPISMFSRAWGLRLLPAGREQLFAGATLGRPPLPRPPCFPRFPRSASSLVQPGCLASLELTLTLPRPTRARTRAPFCSLRLPPLSFWWNILHISLRLIRRRCPVF